MKKLIAMLMMVVMCASLFTGCGSKTVSIDLSDYLNALYRGSDGAGTARGDFDYTGFEEAVMAGTKSDEFNLGKIVQFESTMVITVSPDSGLKNGDKVTVTAAYDKDVAKAAGIKITGNSKTFTVEGLGTGSSVAEDEPHGSAVELDAFDPAYWDTPNGIVISYMGTSPYGNLEIYNNLPADNPLSKVGYKLSEQQNVHEGDQITVTAYFTVYEMKDEYYFKELTTTYTVGAVDHYLMDVSELDSETIASMKQSAQNRAEEGASGFLEFQTESDHKGFYNGETVTINSNQAGDKAYTFRNDGFINAIAIPCYMNVAVQEPDWMENAQTYHYDLVFLCTVENIIVHADGSITAGEVELKGKGTAETESALMDYLKTGYTNSVEYVGFAG